MQSLSSFLNSMNQSGLFRTVFLGLGLGVLIVIPLGFIKNAELLEQASASTRSFEHAEAPRVIAAPSVQTESVTPVSSATPESVWPMEIGSPEVKCIRTESYVVHGMLTLVPKPSTHLKQGEVLYRLDDTELKANIDLARIALQAKQAELDYMRTKSIPLAKENLRLAREARDVSAANNARQRTRNVRSMLVPYDEKIAAAEDVLQRAENMGTQLEHQIRKLALEHGRLQRRLAELTVRAPFPGTVTRVERMQKVEVLEGVPKKDDYFVIYFQDLEQLELTGSITLAQFRNLKIAAQKGECDIAGNLIETRLNFEGEIEMFSPDAKDGHVRVVALLKNPRLNNPAWKERQFQLYPGELATATIRPPTNFVVTQR